MRDNDQIRSLLFVPGTRPDRVDKAMATQADMVIVDLEDAVPLDEKNQAREIAAQKIDRFKGRGIMVRINAFGTELTEDDLKRVVRPGLEAVMLPKVQQAEDVVNLDKILRECEKMAGVEDGSVKLVSLIESALGVENTYQVASVSCPSSRCHTLAFGAADFCLDMGVRISKDGDELAFARSRIAVGSRAAGLNPPLDTPYMIDLNDERAFEADVLRGKTLGFGGKLCIHPKQIAVCNRLYSPDEDEVSFAEKVVEAFESAEKNGQAAIQVDGKFVDYPVVAHAKRILRTAKRIRERKNRNIDN